MLAIALSLCGFGLTCPALARDLRAADIQVADYPTVQAVEYMSKLVEQRTNGRYRINVFHSRQLGEEKETVEQMRAGAIDINRVNAAALSALTPQISVLGLPFLFRSNEHLWAVLDSSLGREMLDSLEPHGMVGLAFYDSGARSIYNSVRPIHTIADVKGLRIRVQQSELQEAMIRAMGAEPIALGYGQVLTALSTGIIDGAENNWPSYVTTGHFTVARHYSLTQHSMTPEVLLMSRKTWDELTAADRAIFLKAGHESSLFMRRQWRVWEDRAREEALSAGNTIIDDVDRRPFEAAMQPIYDAAMKDERVRTLIERIRAQK